MIEYTLTQEQVDIAHSVAEKIKASKEYTSTWNASHIAIGLLGEMAYAQMKGLEVCTEVWSDRCDGGADFENGVDVKTITWMGPNPELKMSRIPTNSKKKTLVLAICNYKEDPTKVKLIGEISFENFKLKARLKKYGVKQWYAVTVDDLDTIYN